MLKRCSKIMSAAARVHVNLHHTPLVGSSKSLSYPCSSWKTGNNTVSDDAMLVVCTSFLFVMLLLSLSKLSCSLGAVVTRSLKSSSAPQFAAPKRGAIVDSYRTVSVSCDKCRTVLFTYKKKNGTKSNLVKMYLERVVKDDYGLLQDSREHKAAGFEYKCPSCDTSFGRDSFIKGLPAMKIIGTRLRMK